MFIFGVAQPTESYDNLKNEIEATAEEFRGASCNEFVYNREDYKYMAQLLQNTANVMREFRYMSHAFKNAATIAWMELPRIS